MCFVRKEVVISIADLRYVCIECPQCQTKVILDMEQKAAFAEKHGIFAPKECPGCHSAYDSAIQPNIDQLQRAYQSLLEIADRITFCSASVGNGEDRASVKITERTRETDEEALHTRREGRRPAAPFAEPGADLQALR